MPVHPDFANRLLEIQSRYKSKKELMRFVVHYLLLVLPSPSHCTLHFIQQILTGRKRFLYQTDTKDLKVPIRPELSVQSVWPDAIAIPGVAEYFPDEWEGCRRVDRKFFWTVLCALHAEYVQHLIRGSREARAAHKATMAVPRNLVQPTDDWVDNLLRAEGFVPVAGRRVGPSLLVQRQIRQRRPRAEPTTFNHGVRVEHYIEALDHREAQSLALQSEQQSLQQQIPANLLVGPAMNRQATQMESELGDHVDGEEANGNVRQLNLELQSNADSFRTVVGQQFPNRPSNVSMMGPLRTQRIEDFQSANGGSGGN